jgi:hypothetical protein
VPRMEGTGILPKGGPTTSHNVGAFVPLRGARSNWSCEVRGSTGSRPFTLPRSDVLSPPAFRHPIYCRSSSFSRTLRLASTSAASAAACAASKRYRRTSYSDSVSQCVASAFKAASPPTKPERSRAVYLVTSFGSCAVPSTAA